MLRNSGQEGVSVDPESLRTGYNGGYQAMNLATLAGAARIVLLGYDCRAKDPQHSHFFGDHRDRTQMHVFSVMAKQFRMAAPILQKMGVEVINCTPGSALDCFRKQDIASVFPDSPGSVVPV